MIMIMNLRCSSVFHFHFILPAMSMFLSFISSHETSTTPSAKSKKLFDPNIFVVLLISKKILLWHKWFLNDGLPALLYTVGAIKTIVSEHNGSLIWIKTHWKLESHLLPTYFPLQEFWIWKMGQFFAKRKKSDLSNVISDASDFFNFLIFAFSIQIQNSLHLKLELNAFIQNS